MILSSSRRRGDQLESLSVCLESSHSLETLERLSLSPRDAVATRDSRTEEPAQWGDGPC